MLAKTGTFGGQKPVEKPALLGGSKPVEKPALFPFKGNGEMTTTKNRNTNLDFAPSP